MGEVISDVMYSVGDGINGGEEMSIVLPLINEFVIIPHNKFISSLKEIVFDRKVSQMVFRFYIVRYMTSNEMNWLISSIRDVLINIYKLVNMYEEYRHFFFYIALDHTHIKQRELSTI